MRTYIFTLLEKRVLTEWLNNEVPGGDIRVRKILSRIRLFKNLAGDVDLYLRLKRRLAESEAAAST
jgi:hypothetical protein